MAEINDFNVTDASNTARWPENMAPSAVNNAGRADEGILARWHKDTNGSVATTGSADTYVMAANQTLSAYYDGLVICVDINATNTGASTINVDSLGAKSILKHNDQALAAGDLEAGGKYLMIYDGTSFQLLSALGNAPAVITADNSFTADQTIVSTDAGAAEGPALNLDRNSASSADADEGPVIRHKMRNDAAGTITAAKVGTTLDDASSGSEDTTWWVDTYVAGTQARRLKVGAGLYMSGATGGDQGADTGNFSGIYDDGERVEATKLDTEQATTSGTEFDFTSPFATTTRIEVMVEGVSLSGTDALGIQLGDGGGIEATGYTGGVEDSSGQANFSTEFQITRVSVAAGTYDGVASLVLKDSTNNTWMISGVVARTDSIVAHHFAGAKSLSAALTTARLMASGANTFDAGSVNVRWYGY